MWETLVRSPRGRVSARKFIMLLATLLVAVFGYISASPSAYAASSDATWKNDSIVYDGHTYSGPQTAKAGNSMNLHEETVYYQYTAPASGGNATQKAYVIYFAPGADPPTETSANYLTYSLNGDTYSSKSTPKKISLEKQPTTSEPGPTSCNLDGIGWIVCPVSKAIAEAMDYLYGIIGSVFFKVAPLTTTHGSMYKMWEVFRNAANILFVIGFLIIIYGQISGSMLSNYTIKKLLPRLIVSAILVNVSYWICAVAVDISNVLGFSVQGLFNNLRDVAGVANTDANTGLPTWANVTAAVLAGGGAAVAGTSALIIAAGTPAGLAFLLLGALLPAIFAVLVAVAVLAARQALITIFVILSPLAFVAYLLPNTEEWFTRWRKAFTTMLLMFPAFSVIFGGAQLAGTIIIQNAPSGRSGIIVVILGMTVQIVPLFITPFLIKLSSGLLTTIANITNDKSKGVFDRTRNWADGRRQQEQALGRMNRDRRAKTMGYVDGRRPTRTRTGRALSRLANPYDRAYLRDYRRREREGMKSANEAMSEGLFSQTAAGARIHDRTKDAGLEKHYGEAANLRRWNASVYGNPRTGATADPYRSGLHHAAHLETGEAKVIEDRATAHAERDLQTTINANAALRGLKIDTDVDNAHAKMQAANVEAEGKQVFQNEVMGDRALRLMNVQTVAFEKEAALIESTLQKRAEAHWERITSDAADPQFDRALRNMRLQEVEASDSHKKAEAQWNKLVENIRAEGKNAPDIVLNDDKTVAGKIQRLGQDIAVEELAITSAKIVQQGNLTSELKMNDALRTYAGGVGGATAAARVYAKAKKEGVSEWFQDIENQRTAISEYSLNDLMKLYFQGTLKNGAAATEEQKLAAQQEILQVKGNNWAVQQLKDHVRDRGMFYEDDPTSPNYGKYYDDRAKTREVTDPDEIELRRTEQQMFIDGLKKSKNKLAHVSGTDMANMEAGIFTTSSHDAIIRDIKDAKYSPQTFLDMDPDELSRIIEIVRHEDERDAIPERAKQNVLKAITDLQADPQLRSRIKGRERGLMNTIAAYLDPVDDRTDIEKESGYWANPGTLERAQEGDPDAVWFDAPVRAPSTYRVGDINVYRDGAGPDGTLSSRP